LVGGYQIAGVGHMSSSIFQPASSHWGVTNPIHVYKHSVKITDCTSGNCYPEYLWFNGYISPKQDANSGYCTAVSSTGQPECIYGLPSNYVPYEAPIINNPSDPNFGNDYVTTITASGATINAKSPYGSQTGTNPFAKTFLRGPNNWESDLSLYKVFPVTERYNLRFNADCFNFLNHQGWNNPNTTNGIEEYFPGGQSGATSANPGRQIQLSGRFTF
jgi:hypothetical protein